MSSLKVNQIRAKLRSMFEPFLDLNDIGASDSDRESKILSRSLAALAVYLKTGCAEEEAAAAVWDGSLDNGIDAAYFDTSASQVIFVQSKWIFAERAVTLDGNELLTKCQAAVRMMDSGFKEGGEDAFYCLGFVNGIMLMTDEVRAANPKYAALPCYPDGSMTNGQAARIVVKYLHSHPERLHRDAHILVVEALREAFPCK